MQHKRIAAILLAVALTGGTASASAAGPWRTTPVPVVKGDITAVAALDDQRAWAVGYRLVSDDEARPVALRWNGKTWAQESELPRDSFPQALEVRAPEDIWTLGDGVQHWDGRAWQRTAFPQDPAGGFMPEAIDSAASGEVWTVGRMVPDLIKQETPAVFRWTGSGWAKEALPEIGLGALTSVVAVSVQDVWAAGFTLATASAPQRTVVLHWDGKRWERVDSPNADSHTWFSGLHATRGEVWAVGGSTDGTADHPFAARWDGRRWQETRTPDVPDGRLRAVTSTGPGSVWAVGGKGDVAVLLRWHPVLKRWLRTSAPDAVVRGFAAVPGSSSLWAVGLARQGDLVPVITRRR